jgi:outer membrane receptor for ferrienterochelin and colicin
VQVANALRLDAAWSYAKHKYVEWISNGVNFDGKEIESAPRVLGNTRLSWQPIRSVSAQLEWVRVGEYWLEPGNSPQYPKYPGHDLLNVRGAWAVSESFSIGARIYNVADKRYADSAQVSSNTPVYSPGLPRTYYASVDGRF